jgi:hypothetical protein
MCRMMPGSLMALDRPDDDFEAGEARLEQHLRNGGSRGDVPAYRSEPAETRTREEYYEVLHAADGGSGDDSEGDGEPADGGSGNDKPTDGGSGDDSSADDKHIANDSSADDKPGDDGSADDPHVADPRTDHSGWDSIDAEKRPPSDALRVSPERRGHILDGEAGGSGGHRHGIGNPGKTEFPASWNDEKIMSNVLDVAKRPDAPPVLQHRNNRWLCTGTRDSVEVSVIVLRSGEVWTAWPEEGSPGVVRNPKKGNHDGNGDH